MASYNPNVHHRRSIRLRQYDYRSLGAYFVTVCTHQHMPLFGEISNKEMRLTGFDTLVVEEWERTAEMRPHVTLDAFVVMPNHFHAVVLFEDASLSVEGGDRERSRTGGSTPLQQAPSPLGSVIGGFKRSVTKQVNVLRGTPGIPLWQRNYYEHVVRSEASLEAIREYVATNPARWEADVLHPDNTSGTPLR